MNMLRSEDGSWIRLEHCTAYCEAALSMLHMAGTLEDTHRAASIWTKMIRERPERRLLSMIEISMVDLVQMFNTQPSRDQSRKKRNKR